MAQRVVRRLAEPEEQPGREPRRPADIGLRLVAVDAQRVEDMRAKARLGGMTGVAVTITEQCVQPAVPIAARGEIVDQLAMPVTVAERFRDLVERQRRRVIARQTAKGM